MRAPVVQAAAALTAAAGLVHATAAGTHAGDTTLIWLFTLTGIMQASLAVGLVARPTRLVVVGSAVANLAVAGAWVASRTVGIGFVASLATVERVGLQDLAATLLEVAAAATALASLAVRDARSRKPLAILSVAALAGALAGMSAPHEHSSSHAHEHGHESDADSAVAGEAHDHADQGHDETSEHDETGEHEDASGLAVDAIFAGADTSGATEEELSVAKSLIEDTRTAIATQFSGEAAVIEAGYQSIGDGRRDGSFEHFVNHDYMNDGVELDPDHIESLVFEVSGGEKRLVSAMYILERGTSMADVPELAGDLTTWHDHQNLCWDDTRTELAGALVNGECMPGGTLRETAPMLHVWLEDHECGPFSGIENHGGGCVAGHDNEH